MRELNESRKARVVVFLKGEGIGGSRVCDSGRGGVAVQVMIVGCGCGRVQRFETSLCRTHVLFMTKSIMFSLLLFFFFFSFFRFYS